MIFVFISSLLLSTTLPAYSNTVTDTDYKHLCTIYAEVSILNNEENVLELKIVDRVQSELPNLHNSLFIHVIKIDAKDRYSVIQKYAKQQNKIEWICEPAKQHYLMSN